MVNDHGHFFLRKPRRTCLLYTSLTGRSGKGNFPKIREVGFLKGQKGYGGDVEVRKAVEVKKGYTKV